MIGNGRHMRILISLPLYTLQYTTEQSYIGELEKIVHVDVWYIHCTTHRQSPKLRHVYFDQYTYAKNCTHKH